MRASIILLICVITITSLLYGCTTLNINKLNTPSNISTQLKIKKDLKRLEDNGWSDEIIKRQLIEDSEFKLNRRLSSRQRIVDSLSIPLDRLMIVDYFSHGTAGPFEINFYFYDSTYINYSYNISQRPREGISSGNIKDLKKKFPIEGEMLTDIYEKFYVDYPNIPNKFYNESDGSRYYTYEITLPKNNKVNFYKFSNIDGFIVYQLKGKKFVSL